MGTRENKSLTAIAAVAVVVLLAPVFMAIGGAVPAEGAETASADEPHRHHDVGHASDTSHEHDVELRSPDDEEIRRARERFGFAADDSTLSSLDSDSNAKDRGAAIGFPITESEATELSLRFRFQEAALEEISRFRAEPFDGFAGAWIDFNTRTLHVAGTKEIPDADGTLPEGATISEHRVTFDYATLADVADRVVPDVTTTVNGISIDGAAVHEELNRVVVYTTDDLAQPNEYADRLGESYGAPSSIFDVQDAGDIDSIALESTPRGGQKIWGSCSAGPHVWRNTIFGQIPFMTTAAHCTNTGNHQHGGGHSPIYKFDAESCWTCSTVTADIQTNWADNGGLTPVTTYVEGWASPDFKLTSLGGYFSGYDSVGAISCNSGQVTQGNGNCGPILHPLSFTCNGYQNMRRIDYNHSPGDSGATAYGFVFGSFNVPLTGIHIGNAGGACGQGGPNGAGIMNHYAPAQSALGFSGYYLG